MLVSDGVEPVGDAGERRLLVLVVRRVDVLRRVTGDYVELLEEVFHWRLAGLGRRLINGRRGGGGRRKGPIGRWSERSDIGCLAWVGLSRGQAREEASTGVSID